MSGPGGAGGGAAPGHYQVFFGSTHAHSDFSHNSHEFPGTDPPDVGFAKAKAAGADFYFITDHVDSGPITSEQFEQARAAADALTDTTFVASAGIEFHLDSNEANAFDIPELSKEHVDKVESLTGAEYADFLQQYPGAFMQWDHPNRDSVDFGGWSAERDEVIALVEIINDLYGDISETGYLAALDAGWHVGPGAGHDNHGEAWFEPPFRTGVLATSLTRENIHEAIRQQRVFATQEKALKVWYDINGTIMGAVTPSASTYTATVKAEGAAISKVEILTKAGKVVTFGMLSGGVWSTKLTGVSAGGYYFARLTSGGGKTWTAPVWVK